MNFRAMPAMAEVGSNRQKGVRTMLEINGDIGKARERKLRDRQKRRQERKRSDDS